MWAASSRPSTGRPASIRRWPAERCCIASLVSVRSGDRFSIERLRRRLPLPVFVLALILLMVMLGFVCLCMTDHPTQAAERAISAAAHAPAIVEMWAVTIVLMTIALLASAVETNRQTGRASPAQLQRFRF